MTLEECRNLTSNSRWASFSLWVVGDGVKCACETLDDAMDAFDSLSNQFPNKTILLYDLNASTCVKERLGR
jgi:hypothetical protein